MHNSAMVNYAILLLLAALLALSLTASSLSLLLRLAIRHMLQPAPTCRYAADATSSVIPYAPIEHRPPIFLRHPWVTISVGIAVASLPMTVMAGLPWFCLPSPLQLIAIAGASVYLLLLIALLVRGCSGLGAPAATRWNPVKLLLASLAIVLVGSATVWIMDLRVKEKIAEQDRRFQGYLSECRHAEGIEGPAAADLCVRAADLDPTTASFLPHTTTSESAARQAIYFWSKSPLVSPRPQAQAIAALVHQAAQCTHWGDDPDPIPLLCVLRLHAEHAAWQAHQGNWTATIQDLNDLYALAHLLAARGDSSSLDSALTCMSTVAELTEVLIAESATPGQLSSIPLPDRVWCQTLVERYAASRAAELPLWASSPTVIPVLATGPSWRSLLYRVICYDDELRTLSEAGQHLVQISRASASPGALAPSFASSPPPALLSVYARRAAASEAGLLMAPLNLRARRDLLEIAIVCRRFEMRHQRMPQSLQELVDYGLLDSVPTDLWDGAPLRTRLGNGELKLLAVNQSIVHGDDITVTVASHTRPRPATRPAR